MPITYTFAGLRTPSPVPRDLLDRPAEPAVRVRRPAPAALTLTLAPALVLALVLAAPLSARAAAATPAQPRPTPTQAAGNGDGNGSGSAVRVGNGSANRNMVTMGSTRLTGTLHQLTTGVGGTSSAQGGLCQPRTRLCTLAQDVRTPGAGTAGPGDPGADAAETRTARRPQGDARRTGTGNASRRPRSAGGR